MAFLLRKITKPKWYDTDWLPRGEVPADGLVDLRTDGNELSVWRVEPDESNLNAIVAALAGRGKRIDKLDYVLLDDDVVTRLQIGCVQSDGDSPHTDANSRWHRDLVQLTATKIIELAREVKRREAGHKRVNQHAIKRILKNALDSGAMQRSAVDADLLAELDSP